MCISGKTGEGMAQLLELLATELQQSMMEMTLLLPYSAGVCERGEGAVAVDDSGDLDGVHVCFGWAVVVYGGGDPATAVICRWGKGRGL